MFLGGLADCFYAFKVFSFFAKSTVVWSHFGDLQSRVRVLCAPLSGGRTTPCGGGLVLRVWRKREGPDGKLVLLESSRDYWSILVAWRRCSRREILQWLLGFAKPCLSPLVLDAVGRQVPSPCEPQKRFPSRELYSFCQNGMLNDSKM